MLEITIPHQEYYDEINNVFIDVKETTLQLEHSLISLQKWEAKHHKPFLRTEKTISEITDYIRCMTIGKVDPKIYSFIPTSVIKEVVEYIKDPMTAATFNDNLIGASKGSGEFITAETIYYWMISLQIPEEYRKWHLQQLLTLIKFMNEKNKPKKKMSKKEAAAYRAKLNAERLAKYKTHG